MKKLKKEIDRAEAPPIVNRIDRSLWPVLTPNPIETMETLTSTISNTSASEAYATYVAAFDKRLRATRGLPAADKETKIEGLRALVTYLDAEEALGQGASVVMSWDGGEPSHVADASERRASALAKIARMEADE